MNLPPIDGIASARERFAAFAGTPRVARLKRISMYLFQILIGAILLIQLENIGWSRLLAALPEEPVFYILFGCIYLILPTAETIIYSMLWTGSKRELFLAVLRKGIYNRDVLGYSGELTLLHWATSRQGMSTRTALENIRDINVVSAIASTSVAFTVLVVLLSTNQVQLEFTVPTGVKSEYGLVIAVVLVFTLLAIRFRKYLLAMPMRMALRIFAVHSIRLLLTYSLQLLQWHIVLPDIPWGTFFTILSVNIVISRIPFLPGNDLLAASTNIEVAKMIGAPVSAIAGVLLAGSVLDKAVNATIYFYFSVTKKRRKQGD